MIRSDRLVIVVGGVLLAAVAGSAALALRSTRGSNAAGGGLVEVVHGDDSALAEEAPQLIEEPSFEHYRVVTEQNVFRPLLFPPQEVVALAVPAEIPSPTVAPSPAARRAPDPTVDLAMTGVVESNGALMALIKNIRTDDSTYAGVGDSAFGLRVAAVKAKEVTFAQGEESYTVAMGEKSIPEKSSGTSAGSVAAPRPAGAPASAGGGEASPPAFGARPAFGFRGPGGDGSGRFGGFRSGEGGGFRGGFGGGRGFGGRGGDGGGRRFGGGDRRGPGDGGGED